MLSFPMSVPFVVFCAWLFYHIQQLEPIFRLFHFQKLISPNKTRPLIVFRGQKLGIFQIEYPVGCRWFDGIKCLGTDVTAVPNVSVLLSANDGTGFSPAYVFYREEANKPVECPSWAFFRLWTGSVKLKKGITMDEFRKEVEAKMSECTKLFDSDFHWEFRLVCWDSATNKLD